jgi:mannose-6-phosphate isomerase-like protein (cupin superfamily)
MSQTRDAAGLGRVEQAPSAQRPSNPLTGEERPWGRFTVLEEGADYKVKRLEVRAGQRMSLQFHHQRREHWVVVAGIARVTVGAETKLLRAQESADVPRGARHRIENPGESLLVIIEVQHGTYLGEDDIVRIEDDYARAEPGQPR